MDTSQEPCREDDAEGDLNSEGKGPEEARCVLLRSAGRIHAGTDVRTLSGICHSFSIGWYAERLDPMEFRGSRCICGPEYPVDKSV
jgi:hypothetical protein